MSTRVRVQAVRQRVEIGRQHRHRHRQRQRPGRAVNINGATAQRVEGIQASLRKRELRRGPDVDTSSATRRARARIIYPGGGAKFQMGSEVRNSREQVQVGIASGRDDVSMGQQTSTASCQRWARGSAVVIRGTPSGAADHEDDDREVATSPRTRTARARAEGTFIQHATPTACRWRWRTCEQPKRHSRRGIRVGNGGDDAVSDPGAENNFGARPGEQLPKTVLALPQGHSKADWPQTSPPATAE